MFLTLNLRPELEARLQQESAKEGVAPEELVVQTLEQRLQQPPSVLPRAETELLAQINEGFPEVFWQRYRYLIARRQQEALTPEEHEELVACSDRVEAQNVQRLSYLVELAGLRCSPPRTWSRPPLISGRDGDPGGRRPRSGRGPNRSV